MDDCSLDIRGSGQIRVDIERLRELLKNIGKITTATNGETIEFDVIGETMTITLDGEPLEVTDSEAVFEYGNAVPNAQLGMLFANIQTLVRAHNWEVTITPEYGDGIQLETTGLATE